MKKVDVVIPNYNCVDSFEELLHRLKIVQNKVEKSFKIKLDIVFVDDGSTDNSLAY